RHDLPRGTRPGAGPPPARAHPRRRVVRHALPDRATGTGARHPHVLCTQLEVEDGRLTGRHVWPTCWGGGKALAARALAREHGIALPRSYFYTDSDEDLPLLEIVGRPRPTNPNRRLTAIAARRSWPVRRFTMRGTPSPLQLVRSTIAIGSLVPALA